MIGQIKNKVFSKIFFDLNRDIFNTIFLAGTGRSGTTWIEELLNYDHDYRIIFEPFYPTKVPESGSFKYKQYLRPETDSNEMENSARNILSGNIRNSWTDRYNDRFLYKKRIVKDIRANLFLKWLNVKFPQMPIIYLMRHPLAVAVSRRKLRWKANLNDFFEQEYLVEDYLSPFWDDIKKAETELEKNILIWCIENYVVLNQFKQDNLQVVFYEKFYTDPQPEIEKLFAGLNQEPSAKVYDKLAKPSAQSRKDSAINIGGDILSNWKKSVTPEEIKRSMELLKLFNLDQVYSDAPLPNPHFNPRDF